jgi:lactate dehydrogenase-like 2-hydroxyacid dehydrogenase
MTATDILMPGPMPLVLPKLEARFRVHKLWEAADKQAALAELGSAITGIATGGHIKIDAALIDRFPNLQIVANFGVGYDSVDAAHAATRGVIVTNTPDVLTEEVADTAIGLMLMTAREFGAAERYVRAGKWLHSSYPLTRSTLQGKTLGIVGMGRIGKAIAKRAAAFGLKLAYHNRRPAADTDIRYYASLVDLARDVDILLSVLPGGAATHHLIGAEVLEALGPEGILINIGRGSVVDETALIAALTAGKLFSAGLDVFETEPCFPEELASFDRVVLLPHVGSASIHTRQLMGDLCADNLISWFETGAPVTPVAETPWPR